MSREALATVWACTDCLMARDGEPFPDRQDGEPEPWALLTETDVTYGRRGHDQMCPAVDDAREWCTCAHIGFSEQSCDACGSRLAGERHAYTLWREAP